MNAAIPVMRIPVVAVPQQAPPQESSKSTAPSAHAPASASSARDFAGALDRVSAKHSRKDDSAKSGAGKRSGDKLPPAGGNAPPAATPVAVAPTLPQPLGPSGTPVVSGLDEGDDTPDQTAAPAVGATSAVATAAGATSAGATVAVTSGAPMSNVSAGADNSSTASVAGFSRGVADQGAPGAQGSALGAVTPALDPTAADAAIDGAAPTSNGAGPASAASNVSQSSDASAAASASAAKLSVAPAGVARATAAPVSVSKPQPVATGSEAAVSPAAGRAVAHVVSPAGTSAASDDDATPAQPPVASTALINLALVEGSDATGSAASALQAANAAASSSAAAADAAAAAASPFTALQVPMVTPAGAGSAPSATTLDTAALTSAAVVSLGSGAGARGHNGAGDSAADTGSGSLANGGGAAALQQLSTSAISNSSDAAPVPTVSVHADVDSADFPQGVADKVSLAIDNGWSSAKLSVNPPQLGPIELQIAVQGAHAQIAMSTHSAVTREALESSVPTLRDMLNSQGFTNVSVDIAQRSFQERSAPEQPYSRTPGGTRETAPVSSSSVQVSRAPLGMLDTYA